MSLVLAVACVALSLVVLAGAPAPVRAEEPACSATREGVPFGLDGFARMAKGTARDAAGVPEGYRIPLAADAGVVIVATGEGVLAHVDADCAARSGLDVKDADALEALRSMVVELDEAASMGGSLLRDVDAAWEWTDEDIAVRGAYRYRFDARDDEGDRYLAVTLAAAPEGAAGAGAAREAGVDLGDGVQWCDAALLVDAGLVGAAAQAGPLEGIASFLSGIDWRPLWVSLKTAGIALAVSTALGLLAAWRVMGASSRVKGLLDSVFTIPMVLPPTVCGFLLLLLFGQSTEVGRWLIAHGVSLVFTWEAAVISAMVVSFPLVYRTALGAFESLDADMLDAARTLGWGEFRIFRALMLPLTWPSIAAGVVLAFARAMGEFGCTLFFAGNYAGITQTIPIAIYFEWMGGNTDVALFWVAVVIAFSFLVVWGINAQTARNRAFRDREGLSRRHGMGTEAGMPVASGHDGLEDAGGDALRIDREALTALLEDGVA